MSNHIYIEKYVINPSFMFFRLNYVSIIEEKGIVIFAFKTCRLYKLVFFCEHPKENIKFMMLVSKINIPECISKFGTFQISKLGFSK